MPLHTIHHGPVSNGRSNFRDQIIDGSVQHDGIGFAHPPRISTNLGMPEYSRTHNPIDVSLVVLRKARPRDGLVAYSTVVTRETKATQAAALSCLPMSGDER
jgi:hypothetical protein